jgi:hypothetical protein
MLPFRVWVILEKKNLEFPQSWFPGKKYHRAGSCEEDVFHATDCLLASGSNFTEVVKGMSLRYLLEQTKNLRCVHTIEQSAE